MGQPATTTSIGSALRPPPAELRAVHRRALRLAAAELVASTMSGDWTLTGASTRLLDRARGDRYLLLLLRARVAQQLVCAPTVIGRRAAATVEEALRRQERLSGAASRP